jgi:predicted DNA-binding transcriptional regulator AlpA
MIRDQERLGYYTLPQVASKLGVPYDTLYARMVRGRFPSPLRVLPGGVRLYYSEDDVRGLLETYGVKESRDHEEGALR